MSSDCTSTLTPSDTATQAQVAAILEHFENLRPGQSFPLTLDQDPKALRLQLQTRLGLSLVWEVQESGPAVWRIQIGKRGAATSSCCSGGACGG
ncbi:MAG: hypothetical protein A3F78_21865 [Burkholderiales bacterium RIFCSPLOWO2_12_FULL_61_40]|nr:MAG: hypothetical protein A3F78_21865 [Burkholderiales bacterium RIFCSPLOWO2_12_FULL_61_40]